jgi:hypothetical protein
MIDESWSGEDHLSVLFSLTFKASVKSVVSQLRYSLRKMPKRFL